MSEAIETIRRADPMIVLKRQSDLVERMDPGFWEVDYIELEETLSKSGFVLKSFGDFVVHQGQGDTPRKRLGEKFEKEGIQFLSAEDILPSGIDWHNYKYISEKQHRRLARTSLREEDILFARIGVASTGRVGIVIGLPGPCNINNSLNLFRVKGISPYYIVCFLKSRYGQRQVDRLKSGVASTAITIEQIKSITVPLLPPSLESTIEDAYKSWVASYHDQAMKAKAKMRQAQRHGNQVAEERYRQEFERNLALASAIIENLVQQVEEIIEGKRSEIETPLMESEDNG